MATDVKVIQARNLDFLMVGKIVDVGSYYAPEADRYLIKGIKELVLKLTIDSDENKTEGEIQALYGRILKCEGSVKLGKISLEGHAMLLNALSTGNGTTSQWMHIVRGRYLPYFFFDAQSLWDDDNGTADNRWIGYKCKIANYEYTVGQDNMAEVSFDYSGIYTKFPVIRTEATSLACASFGRQETASATLGDTVETEAAA